MHHFLAPYYDRKNAHNFKEDFDVEMQLDKLLIDARDHKLSEQEMLDAITKWAAGRAYQTGGYTAAKMLVLNAIESILLRDTHIKNT